MSKVVDRIYRSRSQMIGGIVTGALGTLLGVALLLEAGRLRGVVLAGIYLILVITICARLANSRLAVTRTGVQVSNIFSKIELDWGDIERFEIGRWRLFPYVCLIRLRNGDVKHAFAIQERTNFPDGSGEKMVEEINTELRERRIELFPTQ